jgi:hypothetical protein
MEPERMHVCRDPSIGEGTSAGEAKVCVPHCQAKLETLHFLAQDKIESQLDSLVYSANICMYQSAGCSKHMSNRIQEQ